MLAHRLAFPILFLVGKSHLSARSPQMIGSISITSTTPGFFMLYLNLLLPVQLVIVFDVPSPSPLQSALIHLFGSRDAEVFRFCVWKQ
jgi:hypothetical protein